MYFNQLKILYILSEDLCDNLLNILDCFNIKDF